MLRIKNNGEWMRLDVGAGLDDEGDDYNLCFSTASEIIAIARLIENHEEEYNKLLEEK